MKIIPVTFGDTNHSIVDDGNSDTLRDIYLMLSDRKKIYQHNKTIVQEQTGKNASILEVKQKIMRKSTVISDSILKLEKLKGQLVGHIKGKLLE